MSVNAGTTPAAATTDTNNSGAATAAAIPPPNTGAATTTTTTESQDEDLIDGDEWLDSLKPNQRKFVKKTLSQLHNQKEKNRSLEKQISDRETADQEAKRKKDIEDGNWKKVADDRERELAARDDKLKAKDQRIIRGELKSAALAQGLKVPEDIELIPIDDLSLDDSENVIGLDKFVKKLKAEKAHWFKDGASDQGATTTTTNGSQTTTTKPAPLPGTGTVPNKQDAFQMTDEEFNQSLENARRRKK